jgi:mxaJ protein
MGVPTALDMVAHTRAYYRSSYVFVSRRDRHLDVRSLDDPVLARVTVGVQLMGDDGVASPPAHVLARRGVVRNVRGYSIQGDYREPNPPARIVDAVVKGDIDVAIVWGPLAGYFAKRAPVPLAITPVPQALDAPTLPFAFDIAIGVRRRDAALRDSLDAILARRRVEIGRLLDEFGVPRVERDAKKLSAVSCQPADSTCHEGRPRELEASHE